jgi:protein ImuA
MAGELLRLRQTLPHGSGAAGRLSLLRREIAGMAITGIAAAPHLASGDPRVRVSLGETRLDRLLAGGLATGALHEITAAGPGDAPAAAGFALALAARFAASRKAPLIWIGEDFAGLEQGALYGPGLTLYGLDPDALVLVHAANAKDALWAMEEALKCRAPAAVIGEIFSSKLYDLTASRRLVLAAQKHGTAGLLFLGGPARAETLSSSAETRFEIRARPSPHSASAGGRASLPGPAAFDVRIAKARAGPNGVFIDRDKFHPVLWSHREVLFRDALSLPLAAVAGDGSDHPPQRRSA